MADTGHMDIGKLKKFAQGARRQLREQVGARLEQVLRTDSVEIREQEKRGPGACGSRSHKAPRKRSIDRVAYTWFNRFCALRFMDVNHYTRIGVVSPAEGFTQPEILQEAKQGYIDDDLKRFVDQKRVFDLLNGRRPSCRSAAGSLPAAAGGGVQFITTDRCPSCSRRSKITPNC